MDDEADGYAESASGVTTDNYRSSSYGGAIFSQSHHFTVAGGTFNVTNRLPTAQTMPSDFRMIPMGEIDLQHEIGVDNESGLVFQSGYARQMCSAKVEGRQSSMTVAIYQGDRAEEEWRRDVARYMTLRHPNIIQLHAAASVNNIHATVFHDDLIPFEQFLDRCSPIMKVYSHARCIKDFWATQKYFSSVFQRSLWEEDFTLWIRCSSGWLCADLIPSHTAYWAFGLPVISHRREIESLDLPNQEAIAIDALTLEQYHKICYWGLSRCQNLYCSSSTTVNLKAIIACPSGDRFEDSVEIGLSPHAEVDLRHWRAPKRATREVMEGGWTRFASSDIFNSTLSIDIWNWNIDTWLSQANHIFSRLGIPSNFEDYILIEDIYFHVTISPNAEDPPMGYLFLCPLVLPRLVKSEVDLAKSTCGNLRLDLT
ncbi:hypothetical protein B0H13DRAFT_2661340 [Mycena leptocephala]|nr:hypothetical protein B0H13DRAFT_2661340 [Mycena leptocephala]